MDVTVLYVNAAVIFLIRFVMSAALVVGSNISYAVAGFMILVSSYGLGPSTPKNFLAADHLANVLTALNFLTIVLLLAVVYYIPIGSNDKWGNSGVSRWLAMLLNFSLIVLIFNNTFPGLIPGNLLGLF